MENGKRTKEVKESSTWNRVKMSDSGGKSSKNERPIFMVSILLYICFQFSVVVYG